MHRFGVKPFLVSQGCVLSVVFAFPRLPDLQTRPKEDLGCLQHFCTRQPKTHTIFLTQQIAPVALRPPFDASRHSSARSSSVALVVHQLQKRESAAQCVRTNALYFLYKNEPFSTVSTYSLYAASSLVPLLVRRVRVVLRHGVKPGVQPAHHGHRRGWARERAVSGKNPKKQQQP